MNCGDHTLVFSGAFSFRKTNLDFIGCLEK